MQALASVSMPSFIACSSSPPELHAFLWPLVRRVCHFLTPPPKYFLIFDLLDRFQVTGHKCAPTSGHKSLCTSGTDDDQGKQLEYLHMKVVVCACCVHVTVQPSFCVKKEQCWNFLMALFMHLQWWAFSCQVRYICLPVTSVCLLSVVWHCLDSGLYSFWDITNT